MTRRELLTTLAAVPLAAILPRPARAFHPGMYSMTGVATRLDLVRVECRYRYVQYRPGVEVREAKLPVQRFDPARLPA